MIALDGDGTLLLFGEEWHLGKFAFGEPSKEVRATENKLVVLDSVNLRPALSFRNHQAHRVPLAGWLYGVHAFFGLIELIQESSRLDARRNLVVVDLDFGARVPSRVALFGNVKHDAAVLARVDVEVELQLKPFELLIGDDVARVLGIGAG